MEKWPSAYKRSNIYETRQQRPKLLLRTNRKSHIRFRLVPKSTTLDDFEGTYHYALYFKRHDSCCY